MVILAAVDRDAADRIVEVGHDLATDGGEQLVVLHVMTRERFDDLQETEGPVSSGAYSTRRSERQSGRGGSRYNLEDGRHDAEGIALEAVDVLGADADVRTEGAVGEPVEEILAAANEHDARYLVIGGRKRSPVGKAIFGSVTQSVLLNADRPVVTVMAE